MPYKGRVVDLGCGNAPYKADILKVAREYIGVDWKQSFHDQSHVDVFCDLSGKLSLEDDYADTVVSFAVMEHVPEPSLFLSECHRILRPGGSLFITVPFMWHVHEAPHDYYRYTRYGLQYLLVKNGFSEIQIRETTGFWQTFVLKFNYHMHRRFAGGPFWYFWIPFWWLGQVVSPLLDRFDQHPEETAGYIVQATKSPA